MSALRATLPRLSLPPHPVLVPVFAAVAAALAIGTDAGGRSGVACGSLLVVLVALPSIWRLRTDHLDAPGIYALVSALTFGLSSLQWIDATPPDAPPGIGQSDISEALLVTAAGLAAFGAGTRLAGAARRRPRLEFPAAAAPAKGALIAVFAVGAAALAAGLAVGVLGYNARGGVAQGSSLLASAQAFGLLADFGLFAVLICALAAFGTPGRGYSRLLAALLALQAIGGFAAGYKLQTVLPFVLVGFAFVTCRARIPWRAVLAGVAMITLVVAPANFLYRHYLRSETSTTVSVHELLDGGSDILSTRTRLIDNVALIHARTPSVYARGTGDRYVYLPALIVVPRAVWPDKPVFDEGLEFSHTYWQLPSPLRTLTPLTQAGDLLRNFGMAGVVVGLGVWGALLGLFTAICRRLRSLRTEVVYLVALASGVLLVETALPELLGGATHVLPLAAAVAWFLLPGSKGQAGYRRLHARLRRPAVDRAAHVS